MKLFLISICYYNGCKLDSMIAILAPITNKMMHTIMNIKTNFFMMCSVYHYINKVGVLLPVIKWFYKKIPETKCLWDKKAG
ncbi:hypothetical protein CSW08_00530 [Confluentibacter flavum]|uniref:Uncharacterized protein n=1 Tax=Confluentibacter flavum TaxID=1909700 RepID=A0A2N3HPI6_9FLAO|nr:hypothetical protein CSW08_00530 [Confluentibacter flavum]